MRNTFAIIIFLAACLLAEKVCSQNKTDSLQKGIRITEDVQNPRFENQFTTTTCEYVNDKKNGQCIVKNSEEEVLAEISFVNDKKQGPALHYKNNKVFELAIFKNDTLLSKQTYSKGNLYKSEFYIVLNDSVVLNEEFHFKPGGKKWRYRKYEGGILKTEIVYGPGGKTRMRTEFDNQGKAKITKY
ncbi:MAG: hypothetical protein IAF38_14225 [Bacteroidia bacterium]|nr:hypothetical protein [Bacteroidia bacterium]